MRALSLCMALGLLCSTTALVAESTWSLIAVKNGQDYVMDTGLSRDDCLWEADSLEDIDDSWEIIYCERE